MKQYLKNKSFQSFPISSPLNSTHRQTLSLFFPNKWKITKPSSKKIKIHVSGLHPNRRLFYFAAKRVRSVTDRILSCKDAYGSLQNSGMTLSDTNGHADFYLYCPTVYYGDKDHIRSRHFHFVYQEPGTSQWSSVVYTYSISCELTLTPSLCRHKGIYWIYESPPPCIGEPSRSSMIPVLRFKTYTDPQIVSMISLSNSSPRGEIPIGLYYQNSSQKTRMLSLKTRLDQLGFVNHFMVGLP